MSHYQDVFPFGALNYHNFAEQEVCFCPSSGRETEWLFSSKEGQDELATNAGFERVVIATLGRGHAFSDMDMIKQELSTKVMELAPKKLNRNVQVTMIIITPKFRQ